jgi:hypothetical protein
MRHGSLNALPGRMLIGFGLTMTSLARLRPQCMICVGLYTV